MAGPSSRAVAAHSSRANPRKACDDIVKMHANARGDILASLPEPARKQQIGDWLFPLVQSVDAQRAGFITGMLLELEPSELLDLLGSFEALYFRVAEAQVVLDAAYPCASASGLGSKML